MCVLSIVIVNYNTRELLLQCLRSLREAPPPFELETVVVDNGSSDTSVAGVREHFPQVNLIEAGANLGFSKGNNAGIRAARGRYVLLLNSDTVVLPGALEKLVRFLEEHPEAGAVGPMLLNEDRTLQRSWFDFPSAPKQFSHILGVTPLLQALMRGAAALKLLRGRDKPAFLAEAPTEPRTVHYLLFAAFLVRREVLDRIGLLDEDLFFYHEDCEYGYRMAKHGLGIYFLPDAQIVHLGGGSSRNVVLTAYREYYRSILHVFGRHGGAAAASQMRAAIALGFLWRSVLCCVGGYRNVAIPGTYDGGAGGRKRSPHSAGAVLKTYLGIVGDALRGASGKGRV